MPAFPGGLAGWSLPEDLRRAVSRAADEWQRDGKLRRLHARDATLWTGSDEARWLGWLDAPADPRAAATIAQAVALREDLRRDRLEHAVLLGMGGSSLCPEVLARTLGRRGGCRSFHVLDTTDPGQLLSFQSRIDLRSALFIVSSKSGTTLESDVLRRYFFDRVRNDLGADAGGRFVAITDPGSALESIARADGFRAVFHGVPAIGGRYSALSAFGLVPAVIMGIDAERLLRGAAALAAASAQGEAIEGNEAVLLGIVLGVAASRGRDKVTFIASPELSPLGAWIEQLLAESTGKQGRGAIPIDGEATGAPGVYGEDRLFVHLRAAAGAGEDVQVEALRAAGHPVVTIAIDDLHGLGGEFFRWEMAAAVAGSVLGINPFDQPDVEASKAAARRLTAAFASAGALPPVTPLAEEAGIRLFADAGLTQGMRRDAAASGLAELLSAHLGRLRTGDHFAMLAWVARVHPNETRLQEIRHMVRDATRAATSLGFGPRYLHSTGQEHKGGPASGVFLQITSRDATDLTVPGGPCSFGILKTAQARGDFDVLVARGRRVLRADLGSDAPAGLGLLRDAVRGALG